MTNRTLCTIPLLLLSLNPLQAQNVTVEPGFVAPFDASVDAHMRSGLLLLVEVHDTLAQIISESSAQESVPNLIRLTAQLNQWGQGFSALPPLESAEQNLLEQKYLPIIEQINARLRSQSSRLYSAEYYGSTELPKALIQMVRSLQ